MLNNLFSLIFLMIIILALPFNKVEAAKNNSSIKLNQLLNKSSVGVRPITAGNYKNSLVKENSSYILSYQGKDEELEYIVSTKSGWPGEVKVKYYNSEGKEFLVASNIFEDAGPLLPGEMKPDKKLVEVLQKDNSIILRHSFKNENNKIELKTKLSIKGKTLIVDVEQQGKKGVMNRLNIDPSLPLFGNNSMKKDLEIPYLVGPVVNLTADSKLFFSLYFDWTVSNASSLSTESANYRNNTKGERRPINEKIYLTVSSELGEVLPNIPNPPSPVKDKLSDKVVVDVWRNPDFQHNQEIMEDIASYGVKDLAIIHHVWQHKGFDNAYPNVLPANPDLGGDKALKKYINSAQENDYLFALHENYNIVNSNAEVFNTSDIALDSEGNKIKGYASGSYALKRKKSLEFAKQFSPKIQETYNTKATFLDVHPSRTPWDKHFIDFNASNPEWGLLRNAWSKTKKLHKFLRETYGILLGEGYTHWYWAGTVDGVEAHVDKKENTPWLVDFDLLKLHPQMVNHGMGYLQRWWLPEDDNVNVFNDVPPQYKLDKYRAMELAFGHAGFIPNQIWQKSKAPWAITLALQEYFLMNPIQKHYTQAKPISILYELEGNLMTASSALRKGYRLNDLEKLVIEYDSGLKLWVNGSENDWQVENMSLPPYGFLAKSRDLLAYTAKDLQGIVTDMALTEQSLYVNARTVGYGLNLWGQDEFKKHMNPDGKLIDFGPIKTDGCVIIEKNNNQNGLIIRPIPRSDKFTVKIKIKELLDKLQLSEVDFYQKEYNLNNLSLEGYNKNNKLILDDLRLKKEGNSFSFKHSSEKVAYYYLKVISK